MSYIVAKGSVTTCRNTGNSYRRLLLENKRACLHTLPETSTAVIKCHDLLAFVEIPARHIVISCTACPERRMEQVVK